MRIINWFKENIFPRHKNLGFSGCVRLFIDSGAKLNCLGQKSYLGLPIMGRISFPCELSILEMESGAELQLEEVSIGRGSRLSLKKNSKLTIGARTYLSNQCLVSASSGIEIGSDCAISWQVQIFDDNGHSKAESSQVQNIQIGNNVWIGARATILPGSRIGSGSIIAAGAVVKGTFPERCLIGGVPAKVIRENIDWKNPPGST